MKPTTLAAVIPAVALLFFVLAIFAGKPTLACYAVNSVALLLNLYLVAAHYSFTHRAQTALCDYKAEVEKLRDAMKF